MKFALSILCENPRQRTGLSTLFHEFVRQGLRAFPDVEWIIVAGPQQEWTVSDPRVEVLRGFPSNERRAARLWADHFSVAPAVKRRGANVLLTVGFVPLRTAGLPVVMHVFSFHHQRGAGPRAWYRRNAIERGLQRAVLVILNSQWAAQQLPSTTQDVLVSYEGIDHERFRPEGRRGRDDLPREYLLWAGNFYGYKRVDHALAAYAQLPVALRQRFPFVLVGGDWEGGRARAAAEARRLGLEATTHFVGWVADEDLPAIYRGARAQILSSSEETFGRSVAEAMACGCPNVIQDLPVLREVTGGAAVFVDYADPAAASDAVRRICTDDASHERVRGEGLRRSHDFSFEQLARERIEAIRQKLVSAP